jgi:hypothetical protein
VGTASADLIAVESGICHIALIDHARVTGAQSRSNPSTQPAEVVESHGRNPAHSNPRWAASPMSGFLVIDNPSEDAQSAPARPSRIVIHADRRRLPFLFSVRSVANLDEAVTRAPPLSFHHRSKPAAWYGEPSRPQKRK